MSNGDLGQAVYAVVVGGFFLLLVIGVVNMWIGVLRAEFGADGPARRRPYESRDQTPGIAESPLEERFLARLRQSGFAEPVLQHTVRVGWFDKPTHYRFDFAYPDLRLDIETDGVAYHAGREAYDRRRDRRVREHGWTVVRFRWDDVMSGWHGVKKDLISLGVPQTGAPRHALRSLDSIFNDRPESALGDQRIEEDPDDEIHRLPF